MNEKSKSFRELERPPIAEVVCAVVFQTVPALDALTLGVYWDQRIGDYPKHSIQPAYSDEPQFTIGVTLPARAFLVSADDRFVLQLQHDRFIMNWRSAPGQAYPRFSDRRGPGLLRKALAEFDQFAGFVQRRFGESLQVKRVELTKVDLLRRGEHWKDLDDLALLVPVTGIFDQIHATDSREVNLRYVERWGDGMALVQINTMVQDEIPVALRVEARCTSAPSPSIEAGFVAANSILNEAFFKLVPKASEYFGVKAEGA